MNYFTNKSILCCMICNNKHKLFCLTMKLSRNNCCNWLCFLLWDNLFTALDVLHLLFIDLFCVVHISTSDYLQTSVLDLCVLTWLIYQNSFTFFLVKLIYCKTFAFNAHAHSIQSFYVLVFCALNVFNIQFTLEFCNYFSLLCKIFITFLIVLRDMLFF